MRFLSLSVPILVLVKLSLAGDYDYAEVLEKSLLFYESQRSGVLSPDNRIPWRGDSFLTDQGYDGEDLSGGYFDGKHSLLLQVHITKIYSKNELLAGDHVKFGFPVAGTLTFLAWGMLDSKEGYQKAGQWDNGLSCLRWGLDYFIKVKQDLVRSKITCILFLPKQQ